jgi:hypothetical protein
MWLGPTPEVFYTEQRVHPQGTGRDGGPDVQSRKQPLAPAWAAHRSNAACIVSWIAMKLERPLRWDPKAERFVNDAEANALLTRPERDGYGALRYAASTRRSART